MSGNFFTVGVRSTDPLVGGFPVYSITTSARTGSSLRGHIVAVFIDRERASAYADYMTRRETMRVAAMMPTEDEDESEEETPEAEPNRCEHCGRTTHDTFHDGWPADNRCDYCDIVGSDIQDVAVKTPCARVGSLNRCSCCGETGHKRPTCKYQHSRRKCAVCGYAGHDARTCTAMLGEVGE